MMDNKQIGERLFALRTNKNMTQKEVATAIGITQAAYGKIETAARGLSPEYCVKLAEFYETTCDYILRGIDSENIDICRKTILSQGAIDALTSYKSEYLRTKRALINCLEEYRTIRKEVDDDISVSTEDEAISPPQSFVDAVEKVRYYQELHAQQKVAMVIVNKLLIDQKLYEVLGQAGNEIVSNHFEMSGAYPLEKPFLLGNYSRMAESAGKYIAGQAFAESFKNLWEDSSFIHALMREVDWNAVKEAD